MITPINQKALLPLETRCISISTVLFRMSLIIFKGKLEAPFAIVCDGGGFAYIASLHEGFPQAIHLSKKCGAWIRTWRRNRE